MKVCKNLKLLILLLQCSFCLFKNEGGWAQPLDLPEALRLGHQRNLQLRKQAESETAAHLEEWVQKAKRLPALDFSISTSYFSEINEIDLSQTIGIADRRVALGGHDRSEILLGVRQPIFTGFRLRAQTDLAKNSTLSEEAKFDAISNEVFHQIHLLFYKAQSLYNQRKILEASQKRLNTQLQHVRNLFEAAQAMAFDTLQVYNQTLTIKIQTENNHLQIDLTNLQMARLLDLAPGRPILEVEIERPTAEWSGLVQLKNQALMNRPELKSLRLAQDGVLLQEKLVRSAYFPAVFGQAAFHYAKPGLNPVANEWMDYFSVGVNLQWNLWRWQGDQKKVEAVRVLHNRLKLEERELLRSIEYEVEEHFAELKHSLRQWRLAEQLRDQQAERYRIVSVQHQNGVASTNDLITAEADLTQAELRSRQALIKYYLKIADLRKATGTIGDQIE